MKTRRIATSRSYTAALVASQTEIYLIFTQQLWCSHVLTKTKEPPTIRCPLTTYRSIRNSTDLFHPAAIHPTRHRHRRQPRRHHLQKEDTTTTPTRPTLQLTHRARGRRTRYPLRPMGTNTSLAAQLQPPNPPPRPFQRRLPAQIPRSRIEALDALLAAEHMDPTPLAVLRPRHRFRTRSAGTLGRWRCTALRRRTESARAPRLGVSVLTAAVRRAGA